MTTVFKVCIAVGVIFLGIVSINHGGGLLCAMLLIVPGLYRTTVNTSWEFTKYKKIRNNLNPLYEKGCYREKTVPEGRFIKWSDLKLIYWWQIYILVQDIVFLVLGIFNDITGRWFDFQWLTVFAAFLPIFIREGIQSYYERILKKGFERRVVWKPFDRSRDYYFKEAEPTMIQTNYGQFKELEDKLVNALIQHNYRLWQKYSFYDFGDACVYLQKKEPMLKIFMLINTQDNTDWIINHLEEILETDVSYDALESFSYIGGVRERINDILKDFFEAYFGTLKPESPVCLTVFICAESVKSYRNMVEPLVKQTRGRYWLPAVFSLDTGTLHIARQKKKYGREQFKKMEEELLELLDINRHL